MRELKLLLDIFERKTVYVKMENCHHNFYFSSLGEEGEKVNIIDEESGSYLISGNWDEVADFIREKEKIQKFICNDECLYFTLLTLVCYAFLHPDPDIKEPDKARLEQLTVLAEKEPKLKKVLKRVS